MKTENIPLKEKFDQLVSTLTELEPIAEKLSRDAVHRQSPHVGSMLGRIRGAIEGLSWHAKFLRDLPDPASSGVTSSMLPAEAGTPNFHPSPLNPSTVSDAKAGTPAH